MSQSWLSKKIAQVVIQLGILKCSLFCGMVGTPFRRRINDSSSVFLFHVLSKCFGMRSNVRSNRNDLEWLSRLGPCYVF